jgi:predicted negative regulator of RcsB-dependent stress response
MAMEERQTQIKERAGLDESRLNTDFIESMKKWGPHLVMGLAIIAGCYAGYNWWTKKAQERADAAYADLDSAMVAGDPKQLERVAGDHGSSTAVPIEAHVRAGEIHLEAARTGVPIGEKLDPKDNKLPEGKAFLTGDEVKAERAKAEDQFKAALAKANDSLGQVQYAIGALTGLASIAEDRGEMDKAKDYYNQAIAKATEKKLDPLVQVLKKRIESLDSLKNAPQLLAAADLPGGNVKPVTTTTGITATTTTGETINLGAPAAAPGQPGQPGVIQIPGGGSLVPIPPPTGAPQSKPPAPPTPPAPSTPAPSTPTPAAPTPAPSPAPAPASANPGNP